MPCEFRVPCKFQLRNLSVLCLPDPFLTFSGIPAWKRLIGGSLAKEERISLITDLFSDRDETETVRDLHGDNAQSFVDVIDEVLPHSSRKNGSPSLTQLSHHNG